MVSIYIKAALCEAVLASAILQFCINVYSVYFNIPLLKAMRQNSIKMFYGHVMLLNEKVIGINHLGNYLGPRI